MIDIGIKAGYKAKCVFLVFYIGFALWQNEDVFIAKKTAPLLAYTLSLCMGFATLFLTGLLQVFLHPFAHCT